LNPDEKSKYEEMAAKDKERYKEEMVDYVPPPAKLESSSPNMKGKGKGKAKAKKDPNAPKRPTTSFLYFSVEMRPKIKEKNPEMTFGELGKKIGELFRALTPDEKEKYETKAKEDKIRYTKELAAYNGKKVAPKEDDDDSDEDDKAKKVDSSNDDSDGLNDAGDDDDDDDDSDDE
jgi:hypothetical protein